jgi:hypothetical protein
LESAVRLGNSHYARSYGIAGTHHTIYGEVTQTLPDRMEGRLSCSTVGSRCNVNPDLKNPITEVVSNDSTLWFFDTWLGIGWDLKADDFKDFSSRIKSAHLLVLGDPPSHFSFMQPTKVKNQEEEKEESAIHGGQSNHHL